MNIPRNDYDAIKLFPKLKWMYNRIQLLDVQKIEWSYFSDDKKDSSIGILALDDSVTSLDEKNKDTIYVNSIHVSNKHYFTDVFIQKGQVKWLAHSNLIGYEYIDHTIGEIELAIRSFVLLHFKRFNGIVTFETYANCITMVKLSLQHDDLLPEKVITQLKKIYK